MNHGSSRIKFHFQVTWKMVIFRCNAFQEEFSFLFFFIIKKKVYLPLHGLHDTTPKNPSRLISFMGRLELDHAVSRRSPPQHSSLDTPLISTMSHLWPVCSQHIPAEIVKYIHSQKARTCTGEFYQIMQLSERAVCCSGKVKMKNCNMPYIKTQIKVNIESKNYKLSAKLFFKVRKVHSPLAG